MNDSEFFESFGFNRIRLYRSHHTDNSAGTEVHFFGYMQKGTGRLLEIGGRDIAVEPGDLFYIPRGCRYHSYWSGSDEIQFLSLGFHYLPVRGNRIYSLQKIPDYSKAEWFLTRFLSDLTVNAESVAMLYGLFAVLAPVMRYEEPTRRDLVVRKATEYLRAHPMAHMREVARVCGVGESTLYNRFKQDLNKTPNRIRQEILSENACNMLITTDLSVEEIGARAGFSSSSYFRKVFYSVTGKTPRQYRKEHSVF